jgi:hypothetical protein
MLSGFCGSHIAERGGIHAQVTSFVYHLDREVARSWRKADVCKNINVGEAPEAVANTSVLVELSNMTLGI